MAWYYLGQGDGSPPRGNEFSIITSDYRLPLVVMDIALDTRGRGNYEIIQRRMGLARDGYYTPPGYRLRTDFGGILRYSYCTPDFIIGTLMCEARPLEDWTMISSQNRWHGVIFAGHPDARLYVQCRAEKAARTLNQQWSVQRKGTLISQRLSGEKYSRDAEELRVWFAKSGLNNRRERGRWVFVEAPAAYAAVCPVAGGYHWVEASGRVDGDWLCCENSLTPVIVEVASKTEFADYQSFQDAILASELQFENQKLTYTGLDGDQFTFYADYSQVPEINGQAIDYAPEHVFKSPFIQSVWNSGIVTITKGNRKKVLDFGSESSLPTERASTENSRKSQVENLSEQEAFKQASEGKWQNVFSDACTGDWKEKWFLDGEIGEVHTGPDGMKLTAGREFKNDAHHMVLWTKESFEGDLKIEYDYTRLDNETRCVNILYIQATGSGEEPYAKDIAKWKKMRSVPAMRMYYHHMNAYHISYAAFPNQGKDQTSYIRARRYIPNKAGLEGTDLESDYYPEGLFATGVKHQITVIKKDYDLFMRIENPDQVFCCHMINSKLPVITEGRIGLRHMYTRSARYQNLRISTAVRKKRR
ncbi:MAG: DUF1961 family protein [Pirellulales bacterium]